MEYDSAVFESIMSAHYSPEQEEEAERRQVEAYANDASDGDAALRSEIIKRAAELITE